MTSNHPAGARRVARTIARIALGSALVFAGYTHLTSKRAEFQAQVPDWLPFEPDEVVLGSGVVEIALGSALIALPRQQQTIGRIAAGFFTAVFPGNIAQYRSRTSAFGLDTDAKRLARLPFQLVLVAWALWSTSGQRRPS